MRIVVTGGAGFIGSHIVDEYVAAGHEVAILDNLWEKGGGRITNVNTKATLYQVDITNREKVTAVFREVKPQIVNHHAAQHSVAISTMDPELDVQVNIIGLLNILKCAVDWKVEKIIFASSGATYGTPDNLPIREGSAQCPESPYGITKMMGEWYIRYWKSTYGLNYTILRYGNIYGPRQASNGEAGVIAIFASRFLRKEEIRIDWDGEQRKDYVYIKDVAEANLAVVEKGENETYVIGTGFGTSVNEIYKVITAIIGWDAPIVRVPKRPGDIYEAYFDSSKANKELNWRAMTSLKEGIEKTIVWMVQGSGGHIR